MKVISASVTLGLAALTAIAAPSAMADDSGLYVGGNIGQSRAKIDEDRITRELAGAGFTTTGFENDNRDRGFKLFGGYQFNKYFALEGGYFDLGKFDFTSTGLPPGTLSGNIKIKGVNLDAVGILPITENFSAFGRVGANYAKTEDSFVGSGSITVSNPNPSKRDTNYKLGLGLQYAFNDSLAMRTEAERYRINDAVGNDGDIDLISVGLVYRFGGKKDTPEPASKVMKAPEPEAPVVVLLAEKPVVEKLTEVILEEKVVILALEDIHFDFDKATLTPEAQVILKRNIEVLQKNPNARIRIAGYTSAAGSEEYNQGLSERRANTVQDYLIKEGIIAADRLSTIGYGQTRPATHEATPKDLYSKAAKSNMRVIFEINLK